MKRKWFLQNVLEEASKYTYFNQFTKGSPGAFDAAEKFGYLDKVKEILPYKNRPWTNEELQLEALKFQTRKQFSKNSTGYHVAHQRGILDQICSHMPRWSSRSGVNNPTFKWSLEKIQEEALKYNERGKFKKGNEGAYDAAKTRKLLDIVCSHMKISRNSSSYEKALIEEITKIYPDVKKLRIRKIKISERPYIKGFDLDALVPSINKAIELDGEYWHSFEVMRDYKVKLGWPEDAIRNYHQIKDDYFKSVHGISVLHISDREWLEKREETIKKILDFLKS